MDKFKNIVIVEDEEASAQRLERALRDLMLPRRPHVAILTTVAETVDWLQHRQPDLLLLDVRLPDGSAFSIFDQVAPQCPVVFTTAYDEYALEAFRVGGLDYLTKPVGRLALQRSLDRARRMGPPNADTVAALKAKPVYRSHLLLPEADRLVPMNVDDVACMLVERKVTHIMLLDGGIVSIERPLDAIAQQLDPRLFFRVNRQYLVAHKAITSVELWPLSRVRLHLSIPTPEPVVVSKSKVTDFKEWYTTA